MPKARSTMGSERQKTTDLRLVVLSSLSGAGAVMKAELLDHGVMIMPKTKLIHLIKTGLTITGPSWVCIADCSYYRLESPRLTTYTNSTILKAFNTAMSPSDSNAARLSTATTSSISSINYSYWHNSQQDTRHDGVCT